MQSLRLVLAGAAIGNGNRGVEALGRSVCDAVAREAPGSRLALLDDGWGIRGDRAGRYRGVDIEYVGVRQSRRWHRPESWAQIRVAQTLGHRVNPAAKRFAAADAVLDLTAGDSFTDLYGPAVLRTVCAPKEAALRAGRPLVLLPQTYGPFASAESRRVAERLVRAATLAYARDARSHDNLLELAGPNGDPSRLRAGVDVAFGLEPQRPGEAVSALLEAHDHEIRVGVNLSGLLVAPSAREQFGLAGNYLLTTATLVRALVEHGAHIFFVPHVHVPGGGGESDVRAITAVRDLLSPVERQRTTVVPPTLDAAEVKWCISRMDWFVGSRMHATIAALSTLTPTAAYAYSDKTRGVFETCGVGDEVVDARETHGAEAVALLMESFERRNESTVRLRDYVPRTVIASREQLRDVLAAAQAWREGRLPVGAIA